MLSNTISVTILKLAYIIRYSFGILLAEMVGNKNPFSHAALEWSFLFMQKFVQRQISPVIPTNCSQELYSLMEQCLSWEPNERPSFQDIFFNMDFTELTILEIYDTLKSMKRKFNSLK
jgi:hypothetical protein